MVLQNNSKSTVSSNGMRRVLTIDYVPGVCQGYSLLLTSLLETLILRETPTNLASVVAYEGKAVALDDVREFRSIERAVTQPVRELVVPDAVVPAQPLARSLRKVRDDVPVREVEDARFGFRVKLAIVEISISVSHRQRMWSECDEKHYYTPIS